MASGIGAQQRVVPTGVGRVGEAEVVGGGHLLAAKGTVSNERSGDRGVALGIRRFDRDAVRRKVDVVAGVREDVVLDDLLAVDAAVATA